jgi:hypothetical protein
MKIIITESQKDKLFNIFNKLLNDLMDNIKVDSEDWGLGEMYGFDEVNSVDHIGVDRVVTFDGIKVYINLYVNKERDDWDNVWSEIQYRVNQHIPHAKIVLNDVIVEQEMGSLNESKDRNFINRRIHLIDDEFNRSIDLFNPRDFFDFDDYQFSLVNSSIHRAMVDKKSFGITKKDNQWIPTYELFRDYLRNKYIDEMKKRFYL